MLKKILTISVLVALVTSAGWTHPFHAWPETLVHSAIRNRDARHLSILFFDRDISTGEPLETWQTELFADRAAYMRTLLYKRDGEGDNAISLADAFPHPRVSRLVGYALRIVEKHAPATEGAENSSVEIK